MVSKPGKEYILSLVSKKIFITKVYIYSRFVRKRGIFKTYCFEKMAAICILETRILRTVRNMPSVFRSKLDLFCPLCHS